MRVFWFLSLGLLSLMLSGVVAPDPAYAAPDNGKNQITAIRTGGNAEVTRLVIETSTPSPIALLLLSEPYRLVIDMPDTGWQAPGRNQSGALQTDLFKGYRFGMLNATTGRLVIDLTASAIPIKAFRLPPIGDGSGHRLVLDLSPSGATAFQLAARALREHGKPLALDTPQSPAKTLEAENIPQAPVPRPRITEQDSNRLPIVFIDAGHGGKDPGAIGVSGTHEKDITLAATLELKKAFEATGKVRVVLSRDKDEYHRLRHRIALARAAQADVFISLHADAALNRKATGVSVFTLSEVASDREAELLAQQENKADLIGGPDLATTDPVITSTLLEMFQRASMNQSSVLAAYLTQEFEGIGTGKRGHRFAGFAVLKAPDIPSVLIEMGFLTNTSDEKRLKSTAYRQDLIARIVRATLRYFEENRG